MARAATRAGSSGLPWWSWLLLALIVLLADQFTKILVVGTMRLGEVQPITSFFDLVRAHNRGAAFSFLAHASGWQRWLFTGIGVVAAIIMVALLRAHPRQRMFAAALALLLGGTLGNVLDRLWHGYVVDFLQFHWNWLAPLFDGGDFPAFNLADSSITLGVTLLLLDELLRVRRGA